MLSTSTDNRLWYKSTVLWPVAHRVSPCFLRAASPDHRRPHCSLEMSRQGGLINLADLPITSSRRRRRIRRCLVAPVSDIIYRFVPSVGVLRDQNCWNFRYLSTVPWRRWDLDRLDRYWWQGYKTVWKLNESVVNQPTLSLSLQANQPTLSLSLPTQDFFGVVHRRTWEVWDIPRHLQS